MADKVIGLKINVVGTEDIVKRISAVNTELEQTKQEAAGLNKALRDAIKKGDTESAQRYSEALAQARVQQNELKAQSRDLNKELALQQKALRAAGSEGADSYKALDAQLSILRNKYKQLSAAEREAEVGQQLGADIQRLNKQLSEQDAQLGVFTRNVGNYEESVVRALRRAGNEKALEDRLQALNAEQDRLQARSKALYAAIEKDDKSVDLGEAVSEFVKVEKQIQENEKAVRRLNDALNDSEKLGSQGGRAQVKGLKKAGKLAGLGGVSNLAGDLFQGSEAVSQFGAAGVAAFGIFAAGGLAFKALSVLGELSKEFQALEQKATAFSGVSGIGVKAIAVDTKAIADTFGKDQNEILKTTQALSKNLGTDFADALAKVEGGLQTGADATGELLSSLEGAAEGARIAGLSIDDLIVFSNEATKDGLLSSRGLEIVNTFGEAIKTNSSDAKAALTDALGEEFTQKLFDGVQNGSISTKDAIQQVSAALTEQGVSAEQASKVFTDAFGAQTAAENTFILGLKDAQNGIAGYIDKNNSLTISQQKQLKANKELASAQQGLAQTFDGLGISIEGVGTAIKTGLLNFVNKALLAFNLLGDGLAYGREEIRKATQAFEEQKQLVAELDGNYTPLLDRFDELNAKLPTLAEGSKEAQAAQSELANIIQVVGDRIPLAVTEFGAYNEALGINSDAARSFIQQQKDLQNILEETQTKKAVEQLQRLRAESAALQEEVLARSKAVGLGVEDVINPIKGVSTAISALSGQRIDLNDDDIIESGKLLGQYGKEIRDLEALLKKSSSGRAALGITLSQDLNAALAATAKGNKGLATEAAKFQSEQAKKNEEAAKAAAEERKRRRDELIEDEKRTREDLSKAQKETQDNITELSISGIGEQTAREISAIQFQSSQKIEAESEALQNAALERIKTLKAIADSGDSELRKQFGTPEQIAEQAKLVEKEARAAIARQTQLILEERDKQIKALQDSRDKAIREAAESIDAQALQNAITEVQQRLTAGEGAAAAINLNFQIEESQVQATAEAAKSKLDILRNANLISEREYQAQLNAIEEQAAEKSIAILADKYDAEQAQREASVSLQKQLIEGQLMQELDAINEAAAGQKEALDKQLEAGLISRQQYADAVKEIDATTAQQRVLAEEIATNEVNAAIGDATAERLAAENELTQAQLDLFNTRLENYREGQQSILREFADAVKQVGDFILAGAKIVDDFFTAAENNRKAEIEARYAAELNGARGNAAAIEQIERRKAAELEKIERQAAARRKAIAIAQAIINGAVAITNILATTPDPTGILTGIRIAGAGLTTAAQIALISSQPFAEGGVIPSGDGFITGNSHAQGGVKSVIHGRRVEVEGGEFKATDEFGHTVIVNKKSSRIFRSALKSIEGSQFAGKRNLLSKINSYRNYGLSFAQGGAIPPTVQVATSANVAGQGIAQMQMMLQLISSTQAAIAATNARIDRLTVVANAQDIVEQGLKDTPNKQAQVL